MIVNAYVLPLNDMSIVSINDPLANLENQRNYGCTLLCTSNINAVVSSMSCFVVVHFFIAFTYIHLAFTSKKQVQMDYQQPRSEHFHFQSMSFVYMKVNKTHPKGQGKNKICSLFYYYWGCGDIICNTEDFVIQKFIKLRFHCTREKNNT